MLAASASPQTSSATRAAAGRAGVYAVHASVDRYAAQITGPGSSDSPARDSCDNRSLAVT
jgi:hypothetical protein